MISSSHFDKCFKLSMLFPWRCSTLLAAFSIIISCATSGKAEIGSETREIFITERSILIGFEYNEALAYFLSEDQIIAAVGNNLLAPQNENDLHFGDTINSIANVSFSVNSSNQGGCYSAFGVINAGALHFEFGLLVDPENLRENRPIVAASHLFNCSTEYNTNRQLSYRMRSVDDRQSRLPIRLLSVDIETREATIVEIEVEQ